MKHFDYIIVGGGSAGCVLADKLSACGRYRVCLLEAGPKDDHWLIKLPLGIIELIKHKTLNWQFNSAPEPSQNNRSIYNPRGKTLGGSSSINAMLYVRGQAADYDHWAELGNKGWSYQELLPYFKAVQHQERGEDDFHGTGGPLNVADCRSKLPVFDDFLSAFKQAGFPENNDFNGANQEGAGYFQLTQKNGLRCSAADAFLTPNLKRSNLTVFTNVLVEKVLTQDRQAYGVSIKYKGIKKQLVANKEVILSAGSFNSPQLLMLSGIGDKEELKQHDIDLVHHLPGVGKNLQEHVDILVVNKYRKSNILAYRPKVLWHGLKHLYHFISRRTGLLTSPVAEAGGFIKSKPQLERPDLQLHLVPAAMDDHGRNAKLLLSYGISIHACLLRPKSRGSVGLYGNNPYLHPKIQLNMLSESADQQTMIQAVKIARDIFSQSAINEDLGKEIFPGPAVASDQEVLEFLRAKANNIYHPVGSCKMGHDDMAVVDDELKVHGIANLRVVDASIMPTIVSGNTNAPTIMIACKAADMILANA